MRVIALYRVSTDKQAEEGASLEAQQRAYRELAARNGWATLAEFTGCESATQAASERRVLQQVLQAVRELGPDALWVYEQSRLTRGDELEAALLMRELKERGTKILVNGVVRDLSSIDERFMVGIQSLVDRAESERIKERMLRGKREKARQGKKNSGPVPHGYANPPPGSPGRGTLQIVEHEAAAVRRVFTLAAQGRGERAIAAELNALGVPAPRGGSWGKTTVRRTLTNLAYIGAHASGVWVPGPGSRGFRFDPANPRAIIVENAHPPIVERELWDAVHGRPRLPRTLRPRMLTGLLYVEGAPFGGDSSGGTAFYRGPRGRPGLPWLEAAPTDEAVWEAFVSLATGPDLVQDLLERARSPVEHVVAEREIEHLSDQLARQRRRLERLVTMRADGEIDRGTFLERSAEAQRAIGGLERELAAQRARSVALDGTQAQRVVSAVRALLGGRTLLSGQQKRAVLGSIVRRIDVTAERLSEPQPRGPGGRLLGGGPRRWRVAGVGFRLALPVDAPGVPREVVPGPSSPLGAILITVPQAAPALPEPARRPG